MLGSVLVVTIADAPRWQLRPYVALLGLGVILALLEGSQPQVAKGLGTLVFAGVLIQRGEALGQRIGSIVGR